MCGKELSKNIARFRKRLRSITFGDFLINFLFIGLILFHNRFAIMEGINNYLL